MLFRSEAILIVQSDLNEDGLSQLKGRFGEAVSRQGGRVLEVAVLGKRRLSYKIGKAAEGNYLQARVELPPGGVEGFKRAATLIDGMVRVMVVSGAEKAAAEPEPLPAKPNAESA